MTKMFYVCLHSNKRVERPSQPKFYSLVNSSAFVELFFFSLQFVKQQKKKYKSIGASWNFTTCVVGWQFCFCTRFLHFAENPKTRAKKYQDFECLFYLWNERPWKWVPGARFQGINISRQATPISIGQPATVLYLRVIFQFIKLVGGSPLFTNIVIFQQT